MSASTGCSPVGQSSGSGMSMFRWLEVLEKEFDKAFVDVDLLLGEIDPDQVDITYEGRQKMTTLSSCFAQLCHKAQTVFQLNHKLEVEDTDTHTHTDSLHTGCTHAHICMHTYILNARTYVCIQYMKVCISQRVAILRKLKYNTY